MKTAHNHISLIARLSFRFIEMTFYARSSLQSQLLLDQLSTNFSHSLFSIIHSNIAYEMKNKSLN